MKALAIVLFAACFATSCKRGDPSTFISVTNHSGGALTDIELTFPRGTFGHPRLKDGEVFRHWGPATSHCNVTLKFADDEGRDFPAKQFDFGETCPAEIQLEVDSHKNVTSRVVQKLE